LQSSVSSIHSPQLISILLNAKPFLLSRCLNAIPTTWDQPTLSPPFLTSLSYICFLLEVTALDHSLTSRLSSSGGDPDKEAKAFVLALCSSLLPSGWFPSLNYQLYGSRIFEERSKSYSPTSKSFAAKNGAACVSSDRAASSTSHEGD
jgi:hypothetical protein